MATPVSLAKATRRPLALAASGAGEADVDCWMGDALLPSGFIPPVSSALALSSLYTSRSLIGAPEDQSRPTQSPSFQPSYYEARLRFGADLISPAGLFLYSALFDALRCAALSRRVASHRSSSLFPAPHFADLRRSCSMPLFIVVRASLPLSSLVSRPRSPDEARHGQRTQLRFRVTAVRLTSV